MRGILLQQTINDVTTHPPQPSLNASFVACWYISLHIPYLQGQQDFLFVTWIVTLDSVYYHLLKQPFFLFYQVFMTLDFIHGFGETEWEMCSILQYCICLKKWLFNLHQPSYLLFSSFINQMLFWFRTKAEHSVRAEKRWNNLKNIYWFLLLEWKETDNYSHLQWRPDINLFSGYLLITFSPFQIWK